MAPCLSWLRRMFNIRGFQVSQQDLILMSNMVSFSIQKSIDPRV